MLTFMCDRRVRDVNHILLSSCWSINLCDFWGIH